MATLTVTGLQQLLEKLDPDPAIDRVSVKLTGAYRASNSPAAGFWRN